MLQRMKKHAKTVMLCTLAAGTALSFSTGASAKAVQSKPAASYRTVIEIEDWGAVVTKVILDLGKSVPKGAVGADTFTAHVARSDSRLVQPFLVEGNRKIVNAYVSDKNGKPTEKGRYAVLEMEIGPSDALGSALNYDWAKTGYNAWTDNEYTITQQQPISTGKETITGIVATQFAGEMRELVDEFTAGKTSSRGITLNYVQYKPAADKKKNPLIIWLHGAGEGGTDPTMPISANKAANFASEEIQAYFGGAYVLAPQSPTFWMDGYSGFGDGTSKYESSLMDLIRNYVLTHSDIDPNRIYLGGDSNGGYMSMLLARDYTSYFAAVFPTCEALKDTLLTDADIRKMKSLPMWFTAAQTDSVVPVNSYTVPTYNRLVQAGAKNVHLSLFDNVVDTSGLYKNSDGTPYEYNGHWSWIYVYNNEPMTTVAGKRVSIMEWLASQSLPAKH